MLPANLAKGRAAARGLGESLGLVPARGLSESLLVPPRGVPESLLPPPTTSTIAPIRYSPYELVPKNTNATNSNNQPYKTSTPYIQGSTSYLLSPSPSLGSLAPSPLASPPSPPGLLQLACEPPAMAGHQLWGLHTLLSLSHLNHPLQHVPVGLWRKNPNAKQPILNPEFILWFFAI